jgi:FkbM family methyltransferase
MINKILTVIKNVKNWYLVPIDKIFGGKNIVYIFRNNLHIECRTKSTDINEAVVVLSTKEYPLNLSVLDNRDKKVIFDLGGNIGTFAVWFDHLNKGVDYAGYIFEPHLGNSHILKKNLKLNNVTKFSIIKKAVSGTSGIFKFDISGGFDAFKIDENSKNFIEVEAVKLSDFCKNNNLQKIDLFKIDIEGGEYNIIENDLDFISSNIKVIMMEYHNIDNNKNFDYIQKKLETSFIVNIEHGHAGGGILSAVNKYLK